MSTEGITLQGLSVHDAEGRALVEGVSATLAPGQPLVVIGETGSGKSLVAQALMGLLPPGLCVAGTLQVPGVGRIALDDTAALRGLWARETMLVPQEPAAALDPTKRVGRLLALGAHGQGVAQALAAVDLAPEVADRHAFALSGGMAQRVLVALALASPARLVIADEPTKGLDAPRVAQVAALLRGLLAAGRALLVITHDLALAQALGGHVLVLRDGRVIEHGPAARVLRTPSHPYTADWLAALPQSWPPCEPCLTRDDLVLAAHGLSFGHRRAPRLFRDLDLHVPQGGVLALTGPSGCGKTTLGNVLLGLQPPDAGEVSWAGADPYRDPKARARLRQRYQKLHQDPQGAFLPWRGIGQQLQDLRAVVPGLDLEAALPPLLDQLRLRPHLLARRPAEVSGGEAQRLAIVRLLLLQPDLILADEPTSRLDPIVQRETMRLLRQVVTARRIGLVLISHDPALVRAVADEVVALGRVA